MRRSWTRKPTAASSSTSAEATSLNAVVADGGVEKGLTALFTEADRIARFGFTQTELDRYRLGFLQAFERLAASNDEHTSQSLADEYIRNFMQQEPIPGIAYENGLVQRFLPEITLADVNGLARDWVPDRNRVIAVSAPRKPGVAMPDEAALAAVIKRAGSSALTAYVDTVSASPLIAEPPKPGAVTKTVTKAPGVTEWTLSNGVRVVLEADDVQAGRDPLPRLQPRWHVARQRSGFRRRRNRRPGRAAGRARRVERDRPEQEAGRQVGVRPSRHRGDVRRA